VEKSEKEPYKLLKILGCISFIPFALVFALPWAVVSILSIKFRESLLLRSLRARQRVMDWTDVETHLAAGEGTLIIEQANKVGARFWWTPDDLGATAPFPPPANLEDMEMAYITGRLSDPFFAWCRSHYLSIKTGKAFLTRFDQSKLPRGPVETSFFKNLHPKARIVQTLFIQKRD
jgi:hypothetical protein